MCHQDLMSPSSEHNLCDSDGPLELFLMMSIARNDGIIESMDSLCDRLNQSSDHPRPHLNFSNSYTRFSIVSRRTARVTRVAERSGVDLNPFHLVDRVAGLTQSFSRWRRCRLFEFKSRRWILSVSHGSRIVSASAVVRSIIKRLLWMENKLQSRKLVVI